MELGTYLDFKDLHESELKGTYSDLHESELGDFQEFRSKCLDIIQALKDAGIEEKIGLISLNDNCLSMAKDEKGFYNIPVFFDDVKYTDEYDYRCGPDEEPESADDLDDFMDGVDVNKYIKGKINSFGWPFTVNTEDHEIIVDRIELDDYYADDDDRPEVEKIIRDEEVDDGIGSYEYWGHQGYDSKPTREITAMVSTYFTVWATIKVIG